MRALIFLIVLLLLRVSAWAAQTVTIPEGTTSFGPVSVTALHKWTNFQFSRATWTDPNIKADANIEYTTDGKTWIFLCAFTAEGSPTPITDTGINCSMPAGTTQIRGTVVVTGGSITLGAAPTLRSKP